MTRAAVVVLAGGSGSRLAAGRDGRALNKVFLPLAGHPVLAWSLRAAAEARGVVRLVLVAREEDRALVAELLRTHPLRLPVEVVTGGADRHSSELAALNHLRPAVEAGELDVIAIHDGARPLAPTELFSEVVQTAAESGGALAAVPAGPLLANPPTTTEPGTNADASAEEPSQSATSPGRSNGGGRGAGRGTVRAQTPQAFRAAPLLAAYDAAGRAGRHGTDTASTMERFGDVPVRVVPGSATNLKITYPGDVAVAVLLASTARA